MRRFMAALCVALLFAMPTAMAHGGHTDSMGGHYDNATGVYHFHHGYPAHHHPGGICPYDSSRIYPTDPPSRSTQTIRPSGSTSSSGSVSRSYDPVTLSASVSRASAAPTSTPMPSRSLRTVSDWLSLLAGCVFGGGAFFMLFFWPWIHDARKKKASAQRVIRSSPPANPPPVPAPAKPPAPAPAPQVYLIDVSIIVGYHLRLRFSDGQVRYFDAIYLLLDPGFSGLSDPQVFRHFRIVQGVILYWDDIGRSVTAERLYHKGQPYPTITVSDRELPF